MNLKNKVFLYTFSSFFLTYLDLRRLIEPFYKQYLSFFFSFQFQISDQPFRQTPSRLNHQISPSNLTQDQTTTTEYQARPSSDQNPKSDHQNRPPPSNKTNTSDHPTRPQDTILNSSASNQHGITSHLKWYRSAAFLMGWVKGGIQSSG